MSFPRYASYKDSGADWLGEVPAHWEVTRFSRLITIAEGLVDPTTEPFASMALIAPNHIEAGTGRLLEVQTAAEQGADSGKYLFAEGDVIYSKIRPALAKVALAPYAGICSADMYPLKARASFSHSYLRWLLLSQHFTAWVVLESDRVAMPKINREKLTELKFSVPSLSEQRAIAAFLDRETAKIDALVAEQQRLIELLKEKRQAVISHAVTKGLNPEAPMKDSGIEWLGEVPAHWEITPLRWASRCYSGGSLSSDEVLAEPNDLCATPVIGGNGVMGWTADSNISSPVVVIGRVGALCGNVHSADPPSWVTDNALLLEWSEQVFIREYLAHVLRCRNLNDIASKTAQPLITATQVKDQKVPTPKFQEQHAIASYIAQYENLATELTNLAMLQVALLQERRSALISAAVTGQIDVSGMAQAEAA
jgi:type I restriction enzyme S subunit